LSNTALLNKIKEIKKKYPSIIHASWVGGEPLLRKDVVKQGIKLFPFNLIVTNGTLPLPHWKNCGFNVSVDGTKKYHDEIRGKGIYEKVKKNIAHRDDISLACTINRINYKCLPEMIEEWSKTKVTGITFGFHTPSKGEKDPLWLDWKERDRVIYMLVGLKRKYGNFILNSYPILELMLSKNCKEVTANCPLLSGLFCMDPQGNQKLPCVIGPKADCSKCGCPIPYILSSLHKLQLESAIILKNALT